MATQLRQTDFHPAPLHPRPNIRVAFSAGAATLAVRDKAATTPEADSTLDEIAATSPHANTPLRTLLAERNAIMARMNDGPSLSDADAPAVWKQITAIETELLGRDALTPDDAIVKLIAAAQVAAEGHELEDTEAAGAILQARRHFGIGYVHRQLRDALPVLKPVAATSPAGISPEPATLSLIAGPTPVCGEWDAAMSVWRQALDTWQNLPIDGDRKIDDALAERESEAWNALIRTRAPTAVALNWKLQDLFGDHGKGGHWSPDIMSVLVADSRHLAEKEAAAAAASPELSALIAAAVRANEANSAILDAFAARRREFVASFDSDMTSEEESGYFSRMEAYEATILNTPATTIAGTVAKLRITFMHTVALGWTDWTIIDPTHPDFVAGLAEADLLAQGQWSAIEDLARIGGVNLAEQGR